MRLAYVLVRFPKVSETFVSREALALSRAGVDVHVLALSQDRAGLVHPEGRALAPKARWARSRLLEVTAANFRWLRRHPALYLSAWTLALKGNLRSRRFLMRAMVMVPFGAWVADQAEALDIHHLHAHFATHPALAALVASHLTGIPFSFTAHAHDLYVDRTMLAQKVDRASAVVTISDANKRLIEQSTGAPTGKVTVVRCGADLKSFRPRGRLDLSSRTVVCVATFEAKKGHVHLIHAAAELARAGRAVHLRLIGGGELKPEAEQLAESLGLSEVVTFLGPQGGEVVARELAAASAFVLPSIVDERGRTEGVPVALMEAMASGVPVIASDVGAVSELVHHGRTGRLVAPADVAALATAIDETLTNAADSAEMVSNGLTLIAEQFDLERNAHQLLELIRAASPDAARPNQET